MGMGHTVNSIHGIWDQPNNEHISISSCGISILRNIRNVKLSEICFGSAARLSYFLTPQPIIVSWPCLLTLFLSFHKGVQIQQCQIF